MSDPIDRLAGTVHSRLREFGFSTPSTPVVRALLRTAYFAALTTEEGEFVRGSITYADPARPNVDPPIRRRADYPAINKLGRRLPLTVETLVKLARGVDNWSGSIAVYGTNTNDLFIWGVVDQLVQRNIRLNLESSTGFEHPGLLTISMEGVGNLSIYHGDCFLGGLQGQLTVMREYDALRSPELAKRIMPALMPAAMGISRSLNGRIDFSAVSVSLFGAWANTVSRLCIGLRRLGTGGALLITPTPMLNRLQIAHPFNYRRLGAAVALKVLDDHYMYRTDEQVLNAMDAGPIPSKLYRLLRHAETDVEDREEELNGAAKLVISLAALDGVVVLDPTLSVIGFGTKIGSGSSVRAVYDGFDFSRKGTAARKIDLSRFGTRHTSMLRYCRLDKAAVGIVISQDGHVRLILSAGRSLTLWDQVKLLGHHNYSASAVRDERKRRRLRSRRKEKQVLGYTSMPKTMSGLLKKAGR